MKPNNKYQDFFQSHDFVQANSDYAKTVLNLLIQNNLEFQIIVETSSIIFTPDISERFKNELIKFDISNYSFETAEVQDKHFVFRAGFGTVDIIEAEVRFEYKWIKHIFFDSENHIFLNASLPKKINRANILKFPKDFKKK